MIPINAPMFNWGNELTIEGSFSTSAASSAKDNTGLGDLEKLVYTHYNDYYYTEDSQKIFVLCAPKGVVVEAMLSEPVSVEGAAHWESYMDTALNSIGGSAIIGAADFIGRAQGNGTLREPWLSRKLWQGSESLKMNVKMKFVATADTVGNDVDITSTQAGYVEVYSPVCQLLSLVYPTLTDANNHTYIPPGPSPFHAFKLDYAKEEKGQTNADGDSVGHPVSIQIGYFIYFQNCFITRCSATFDTAMTQGGFPHFATVDMTVESYEVPYVIGANASGGKIKDLNKLPFPLYQLNQTDTSAGEAVANFLGQLITVSTQFVDDTKAAMNAWLNSE